MSSPLLLIQLCFAKLEAAQDAFVDAAGDGEIEEDYLDGPSDRHQKLMLAYGEYKKKVVDDERSFQAKQVETNQQIEDDRRKKEVEAERAKVLTEKEDLYDSTEAELKIAIDAFSRMNT